MPRECPRCEGTAPRWTHAELSRLAALANSGAYTNAEMAAMLGRTRWAVKCRLQVLREADWDIPLRIGKPLTREQKLARARVWRKRSELRKLEGRAA